MPGADLVPLPEDGVGSFSAGGMFVANDGKKAGNPRRDKVFPMT